MDRAAFEAEVTREGFSLRETEIAPNEHRDAHTHPFDARLLILSGSFTLICGEERATYAPGDIFAVAAGTRHAELGGPEGARYLAARRATPVSQAAE